MSLSIRHSVLLALLVSLPSALLADEGGPGAADDETSESAGSDETPESAGKVDPEVVEQPLPAPGAAEYVQQALDRLATSQALVIAAQEGQDEAERAQLAAQLVAARRSLEQALVAIGKLQGAADLRALLEESGLVLNEGEKAAIVAEEERRRGLSAKRFEQVVAAMTSVSFSEGRMQQLKTELKAEVLTSSQAWALVELFDFSRDRVEALVFLHPQVVDPENFSDLLSGLKFESDREIVRSRLSLDG
jgi:hypothetical protein